MQTVQMTRDEIAARTGRFAQLQPMEFMKNDTTVSQAVKDIILARKLMPVVLERTQSAFGNDAPIYDAAGLTMFISIMPPGQGPCLHAHVKTFETFIVLEGTTHIMLPPGAKLEDFVIGERLMITVTRKSERWTAERIERFPV